MKFVKEFEAEWERKRRRLNFVARGSNNHLTGVDIRYSPTRYKDFLSHEKWVELNKKIETKSRGTMFISTNERLFTKGIVNIEIASYSNYYRETTVVSVLRWIAEGFFATCTNN